MMTSAMSWAMTVAGLSVLVGAVALVVSGAAWLAREVGRPHRHTPSAVAPTAVEVSQHRYARGGNRRRRASPPLGPAPPMTLTHSASGARWAVITTASRARYVGETGDQRRWRR